MPVYIFEEDAFEKLVEVEGEGYRKEKTKERFGICSFDAFLEEWNQNYKNRPSLRGNQERFAINVEENKAIYGFGGYNRYLVLNDGEIAFLTPAARTIEDAVKAEKIGFQMWGEISTLLFRIRVA